jgi:large subunit ribosomal protein L1
VTFEIGTTVYELKKGRIEYKNDSSWIIHVSVGKVSFEKEKIVCNIRTLIEVIIKAKPASVKGQYIKSISISSTMGFGIFVDQNI